MGIPLVINDRRGQKKAPREDVAIITSAQPEEQADKSSWKNVGYMIAMVQSPAGVMVTGRAVGLRSDGATFVGDYLLAPIYPEGFDWTAAGKKRLDSFLGCACGIGKETCSIHKLYLQQWMEADVARLNRTASDPMPEAIEVLMRAEMARQHNRIVMPGQR